MSMDLSALADFFRRFAVPVVILDLETTGGDVLNDRITEIAFLHFWQGKITSVQQLINPECEISDFVQKLTGISNKMVQDAPTWIEFLPKIVSFLRGSVLIAHNSRFDYSVLQRECARSGVACATAALCSVQLSRKLFPQFHKHSLDSIIERHGLSVENRHRAMSDVQVLAQFLQLALREKGEDAWWQSAQILMNPPMLPENLPCDILQAVRVLPDSSGVSVWRDAAGAVQAICAHEHAYREIARALRQRTAAVQHAMQLAFIPTIGALHSAVLQAQLFREHVITPSNEILRHTLVIEPDVSGCLKARIRPLRAGFQAAPPHGLFVHPKAAKQAVMRWAQEWQLCPTLLGILPHELPRDAPCPVALFGTCSEACATHDIDLHNQSVIKALPFLPKCDWSEQNRICLTERDVLTGEEQKFICDTGAVQLNDGTWFTSQAILNIFKQKFKVKRSQLFCGKM